MLAAAEAHLRSTGGLSLDTAAKAAGVSKTGLMYHFPSKEDLLSAVLERIVDRYERDLTDHLARLVDEARRTQTSVRERLAAYVTWACEAELDATDLVMFIDPRLRDTLTQRWTERLEPWLTVPGDLPDQDQERLLAARLMADGVWFAGASGTLPMTAAQKQGVRRVAFDLLDVAP